MRGLILGMLLLASPAGAVPCWIPPARFDHEPTRPYRVLEDANLRGTAFTSPDHSTIIIPRDASAAWKRCYLRHEKGHVNGWTADHPGLRHAPLHRKKHE